MYIPLEDGQRRPKHIEAKYRYKYTPLAVVARDSSSNNLDKMPCIYSHTQDLKSPEYRSSLYLRNNRNIAQDNTS
jgi:hypothetical protein